MYFMILNYTKFEKRTLNNFLSCHLETGRWQTDGQTCNFPFLFHLDFLWTTQRVSLEKLRMVTLLVHLVHAPSFSEVWVAHLLLLLCVLCWVCLFSMSGLCPWITFFWLLLEPWVPWLLFQRESLNTSLFRSAVCNIFPQNKSISYLPLAYVNIIICITWFLGLFQL